jgi:DNA repair protein RadC
MVEAGKILDIAVLDHIIIGNEKYFSFNDNGLF